MKINFQPHYMTLMLAAVFSTSMVHAESDNLQSERERWVVHARAGQPQLAESVNALQALYAQSQNALVRADLIALLVRQGRDSEALAVCAQCTTKDYSADELENLAKAARNTKQFADSQRLYAALQEKSPSLRAAWLGGAMVSAELRDKASAQKALDVYREKFGEDSDYRSASQYVTAQAQSFGEQLLALQQKIAEGNTDKETVLKLYRTAAGLRAQPIQEELVQRYPQYFTETDKLWLEYSGSLVQYRSARETENMAGMKQSYERLSNVIAQAKEGSELYISALRDRVTVGNSVEKSKASIADYQTLLKYGEQPEYVQDAYAQALLAQGSPRKAANIYRAMYDKNMAQGKPQNTDLVEKLVSSNADLGYYTEAQKYLNLVNTPESKRDFTRTTLINNPFYNRQYFWNVRLEAWNGNMKKATQLMDQWIADHPADPWGMILRGEVAQWDGKSDEAEKWFNEAMEWLPVNNQAWAKTARASAWLDQGNWAAVKQMSEEIQPNDPKYAAFTKNYRDARDAQLSISGRVFKATSPTDSGNEWVENTTLYSPRSKGGHRVYIAQQSGFVPNHGDELRYGRVGVGGEFNLFPFTLNAEAGRGLQLNDKAYFTLGGRYRLNDKWSFGANAAFNSANTPAKALNQDVYTNEYNLTANYNHSATFRAGMGLSAMDFDDGNLRRGAYVWLSQALWQHNRWSLDGSLWADYSKNDVIDSAYYYNPKNSKSLSGDLDLSYMYPMRNGVKVINHIGGGVGRYWQTEQNAENTWVAKVSQEWTLGKRVGLSYEFGRKKAIYDGSAEFQNFGGANLNVRFR